MIQKIRNLLDVRQELLDAKATIQENALAVKQQAEEIRALKNEIDLLKESQNALVQKLSADNASIQNSQEEFQKEIADFKLLKSRLEKRILESMQAEMKEHLQSKMNMLDQQLKGLEQISSAGKSVVADIAAMREEIRKFTDISKNIKAKDFELSNVARDMHRQQDEKLALLRKIDSLERLAAKLRRRNELNYSKGY